MLIYRASSLDNFQLQTAGTSSYAHKEQTPSNGDTFDNESWKIPLHQRPPKSLEPSSSLRIGSKLFWKTDACFERGSHLPPCHAHPPSTGAWNLYLQVLDLFLFSAPFRYQPILPWSRSGLSDNLPALKAHLGRSSTRGWMAQIKWVLELHPGRRGLMKWICRGDF